MVIRLLLRVLIFSSDAAVAFEPEFTEGTLCVVVVLLVWALDLWEDVELAEPLEPALSVFADEDAFCEVPLVFNPAEALWLRSIFSFSCDVETAVDEDPVVTPAISINGSSLSEESTIV